MVNMTLEEELEKIFRRSLDLDDDIDVRTLKYRGIEKWDSTSHMELIAAIEERYDVMLDSIDVIRINSFAAAMNILQTKYNVGVAA